MNRICQTMHTMWDTMCVKVDTFFDRFRLIQFCPKKTIDIFLSNVQFATEAEENTSLKERAFTQMTTDAGMQQMSHVNIMEYIGEMANGPRWQSVASLRAELPSLMHGKDPANNTTFFQYEYISTIRTAQQTLAHYEMALYEKTFANNQEATMRYENTIKDLKERLQGILNILEHDLDQLSFSTQEEFENWKEHEELGKEYAQVLEEITNLVPILMAFIQSHSGNQ